MGKGWAAEIRGCLAPDLGGHLFTRGELCLSRATFISSSPRVFVYFTATS